MKRAQSATDFSLSQLVDLLFKGLLFLGLLVILFGIARIFIHSEPRGNAPRDMDRVIAEIQDLQEGESLIVPVLAFEYSMMIWSTERAESIESSCPIKEDYCACLRDPDGELVECRDFAFEQDIVMDPIVFDQQIPISRQDDTVYVG